jgi:hypothetical protein
VLTSRRPIGLDPAALLGAAWAAVALPVARRRLKRKGLQGRVPRAPRWAPGGVRGVAAVLRRGDATCLERSLILQRWLEAHGQTVDVLIGVGRQSDAVGFHAWIDGVDRDDGEHRVMLRLGPPVGSAPR